VSLTSTAQDPAFKSLNQNIVDLVPAGAPSSDPIREIVHFLYNDATHVDSPTELLDSPVTGWQTGQSANAPGQAAFYNSVLANACRGCHSAQPFQQLQFHQSNDFLHVSSSEVSGLNYLMLGTAQDRVCGDYVMPHALRTHDVFWGNYSAYLNPAIVSLPIPQLFQNFGDGISGAGASGAKTWKANLCTSFLSPGATTPSHFYEQTIQPIWNGKCVACHITGGIGSPLTLTEGDSFASIGTNAVVAPGSDDPTAPNNTLLKYITATAAGQLRMPLNCFRPPEPNNGNLQCLPQTDVDVITAWIKSGAN
jgi:hypothetical protein